MLRDAQCIKKDSKGHQEACQTLVGTKTNKNKGVCHTLALPSIYEGRLFVLFCSYEIHRTQDVLDGVLGVFGKLSMRRGAWSWFHGIWTCRAKVLV